MKRHGETIVIPRRPRRTDAEIVVKPPVFIQGFDSHNSNSVAFVPPVMTVPWLVELAQQDRLAEQMSVCQAPYQVCVSPPTQISALKRANQITSQDFLSLDWFNSQLDRSPSLSPINTSASLTPTDSGVSTLFDPSDWFMGTLGLSKFPSLTPSADPLSAVPYSGEWDTFTFGI